MTPLFCPLSLNALKTHLLQLPMLNPLDHPPASSNGPLPDSDVPQLYGPSNPQQTEVAITWVLATYYAQNIILDFG